MEAITIRAKEETGEAGDPDELNVTLVIPKSAFTSYDVHADYTAKALPEYGIIALSASGGDVAADLQEETGEMSDPEEAELEVVVPKSLFLEVPTLGVDFPAFSTGLAILIAL